SKSRPLTNWMLNLLLQFALGKYCLQYHITSMTQSEYKALGDDGLFAILNTCGVDEIQLFLKNFFRKCDVSDLQPFRKCGSFVRDMFSGRPGTDKFKAFVSGYSSTMTEKLKKWLSYLVVYEAFGENDIRLSFWLKYLPFATEVPYIAQSSESFIIRFSNYTVLEFTEKTMGPLYVYENAKFDKVIKWKALKLTNSRLRAELLRCEKERANRIEHRGDWQFQTASYLSGEKITQ
ncbi:MAG: hypothetical protein Q4C53_01315, partial [Clostridia bacterium]|nr:hypothetical protein [Clostridia bacterium]